MLWTTPPWHASAHKGPKRSGQTENAGGFRRAWSQQAIHPALHAWPTALLTSRLQSCTLLIPPRPGPPGSLPCFQNSSTPPPSTTHPPSPEALGQTLLEKELGKWTAARRPRQHHQCRFPPCPEPPLPDAHPHGPARWPQGPSKPLPFAGPNQPPIASCRARHSLLPWCKGRAGLPHLVGKSHAEPTPGLFHTSNVPIRLVHQVVHADKCPNLIVGKHAARGARRN